VAALSLVEALVPPPGVQSIGRTQDTGINPRPVPSLYSAIYRRENQFGFRGTFSLVTLELKDGCLLRILGNNSIDVRVLG